MRLKAKLQKMIKQLREQDKNKYNDYAIETWDTLTGGLENAECVLK